MTDIKSMFSAAVEIALDQVAQAKITHPEDAAAALITVIEVLAAAETIKARQR